MWKDVLVHVDGSQEGRRRAGYSLSLARCFGAHLTGLHVTTNPDVPPVFKPTKIREVETHLDERSRADALLSEKHFHDVVAGSPDTKWLSLNGNILTHLAHQARYTDLVIVGQYESLGSPESHPLTLGAELVLRCGRPVLVVPVGIGEFTDRPRILVAWDGNPHTVRAVHDALPLLGIATLIKVLTVNPEQENFSSEEMSGNQLVGHLKRHGANVTDRIVVREDASQRKLIWEHIFSGQFDIVVIGAYTHRPWFEVLFGGVTQDTMLKSPIPILISH